MAKYKLKEGVELRPNGPGTLITNENLTDAIAEYLLEQGRAKPEDFEDVVEKEIKEKPTKEKK